MIMNEIKMLEQLRHTSIIASYEFLHDQRNYFIVTELLENGDMFNHICGLQEAGCALPDERQV